MATDGPLPGPQRPVDPTPRHTADLPAMPSRDRTIPVSAWIEAPAELRQIAEEFGGPQGTVSDAVCGDDGAFLRRIGPWLLWRAGPPTKADACFWAARAEDLGSVSTFRLFPDGSGDGIGPGGQHHERFRTWKEDLRDHAEP